MLGILLATTVQIVRGDPDIALSDNATQIIVGSVGAMTGLLGGYMGARRPPPPDDDDEPDDALTADRPRPGRKPGRCVAF